MDDTKYCKTEPEIQKCCHCGQAHSTKYRGRYIVKELQNTDDQRKLMSKQRLMENPSIQPVKRISNNNIIQAEENIQHFEDVKIEEDKMQATTIFIKTKNYSIRVAGIYCPPRYVFKKDKYSELLKNMGTRFIIGGDFSAKNTA